MQRLTRWYEKYVDWYHRKFPLQVEADYFQQDFLQRATVRHLFVSVAGTKLLVMVALDVAGHPITVCHARRLPGILKNLDGFYHGGRLYPARFFHLYLQSGLRNAAEAS